MSTNRDAIVQEIRREFEELLQLVREHRDVTLSAYEMEKHLFTSLLAMGRSLLMLYFVTQSQRCQARQVTSSNGETIPRHSEVSRAYQSVFGKFEFQRSYYYKAAPTPQSQYPADAALNLPRTQCSDLLREWLEKLGVCIPYGKSVEFLSGLLGQSLWGRDLKAEIAEDASLVKEYYQQAPPCPVEEEATILVVQGDGKGVPILLEEPEKKKVRLGKGEKPGQKKEAIVTANYTLRPHIRTPESVVASLFEQDESEKESQKESQKASPKGQEDRPQEDRPQEDRPQNKQYWATLDGKRAAMEFTAQQVIKRDGPHVKHKVALTDGSKALQDRMREFFPEHPLILDFIHVYEYLWQTGNTLFGEKSPKREQWVKECTLQLLCGRTNEVIAKLRGQAEKQRRKRVRRVLEQVSNYYERNIEYMRYDEYLAAGWPIATGVIEGACRHLVKDRCELSGMRWRQEGAECLLRMRCVEENGDWESYHEYRRSHRRRTLYAGITPQPVDWPGSPVHRSAHIRLAA